MVRFTNVVCLTDLASTFDLRHIALQVTNVRYDPKRFNGLIWQHKKIGGTCLLFGSGRLVCNGNLTLTVARKRIRQYARCLEKLGYPVTLTRIHVVTRSAVHTLSQQINCAAFSSHVVGASYEPEIMNAVMVKRESIHFTCFPSAKVIITGIKTRTCLDRVVYPTLLEMELAL